jgi:Zn-dependent protease with chaperone function
MRTTKSVCPSPAGQRYLPPDRESFLDAQRRSRHATWRLSAVCVIAAVVMGIPLSLMVTPLLYAVALTAADTLNYFWKLPAFFWQTASEIARFGFVALNWILPPHRHADPQTLALGAAVMLLPGILLSVALWTAVHMLFRRSGVGGALLALKAREPNQSELKELQLEDVVQEMAIAAGVPAPRVLIVDAPGANAAAIGTAPEDARILVSRRLLDDLNRDEIEGILAHLIASVGNGDLRIAFRMTTVIETCGLLLTIVNLPFGSRSRRVLWRILRYSLWPSSGEAGTQEAATVAEMLSRNLSPGADDIDRFFNPVKKSHFRSILRFIFFPILFTNLGIKMSMWFFSGALLGPSLALLWHTRQYLADASAVQLTRNPDGLASALQKLKGKSGEIPGGGWASHLFIVDPKTSGAAPSPDRRQKEMLTRAWAASEPPTGPKATATPPITLSALQSQMSVKMRAAFSGDVQAMQRLRSFHQQVAAADPAFAARFPNPDDVLAARQGDTAAAIRLRAIRNKETPEPGEQTQPTSNNASGFSAMSLVGFHSSMERRLKRLARMGAHSDLAASDRRGFIVAFVIYAMFAPFGLLIVAALLFLIAIMTLASLTFVVVWLAFIHKAFTLLGHAS